MSKKFTSGLSSISSGIAGNFMNCLAKASALAVVVVLSAGMFASDAFGQDGLNIGIAHGVGNNGSGTENSNSITFEITATPKTTTATSATVTWTVSIESGDTAEAEDFVDQDQVTAGIQLQSGTVNFSAPGGNMSSLRETITVNSIVDDSVNEGNETFTVTITSASTGATITTATSTGTIVNDDNHILSISAVDVAEGDLPVLDEGFNKMLTFTVSLKNEAGDLVTPLEDFDVACEVVAATTTVRANDIYGTVAPACTMFSFSTSDTTGQVSISYEIEPDDRNEGDETLTITLVNTITGAGMDRVKLSDTPDDRSATGTILNDDKYTLSISGSDVREDATSPNNKLLFTVTSSGGAVGERFTVVWKWSFTEGTANEFDFHRGIPRGVPLTFNTNNGMTQSSMVIEIEIANDIADEGDETMQVELTDVTGSWVKLPDSLDDRRATAKIIDDNDSKKLLTVEKVVLRSITNLAFIEQENNGTLNITVRLTQPHNQDVTFEYFTKNDDTANVDMATADTDYTAIAEASSSIGTIEAGKMSTTARISLIDDNIHEPFERFKIVFHNATNAAFINDLGTEVNELERVAGIDEDEELKIIIPESVSVVEANTGQTTVNIPFRLSLPTYRDLEVSFDTKIPKDLDTAEEDTDFIAVFEGAPGNPVTKYEIPEGSTVPGGGDPNHFSVPIVNDTSAEELEETFRVEFYLIEDGNSVDESASYITTVKIIDNDYDAGTDPVKLTYDASSQLSIMEDVSGGNVEFNLLLNSTATTQMSDITFDYRIERDVDAIIAGNANSIAEAGVDFNARTGTHTIPRIDPSTTAARTLSTTGESISVSLSNVIIDDILMEVNQTFKVILSNPTNAFFEISDGGMPTPSLNYHSEIVFTVTIDDSQEVSIALTVEENPAVAENGGELNITVSLSQSISQDVTFEYYTADDDTAGADMAVAGTNGTEDYNGIAQSNSSTVTIAGGSGNMSGTARITINDDMIVDGDETFKVVFRNATVAKFADSTGQEVGELVRVVTITDNDELEIVVPPSVRVIEGNDTANNKILNIPVKLRFPADREIEVAYHTRNTTDAIAPATVGSDYVAITPVNAISLNFSSGNTEPDAKAGETAPEQAVVQIVNDEAPEDLEKTFGVSFVVIGDDNAPLEPTRKNTTISIIDDETGTGIPILSVNAPNTTVSEGESAVFNISATAILDSEVKFSITQVGNFVAFAPDSIGLINGVRGTVSVATIDNTDPDEADGTITLSLLTSNDNSYELHQNPTMNSETVTVENNDTQGVVGDPIYSVAGLVIVDILKQPPSGEPNTENFEAARPTVSISSEQETVNGGSPIRIVIRVSPETGRDLTVRVALSQVGDFLQSTDPVLVPVKEGESSNTAEILTVDDTLAENNGTVTATVQESEDYVLGEESSVSVAVSDHVDQDARARQVGLANEAVLPEIAGAIGARTLGAMSFRVEQAFSARSGYSLELGGQSSVESLLQAGGKALNSDSLSMREVLGDSSFSLDLFPETGGVSTATVWGLGDFRSVSGNNLIETQNFNGDVFTGHIGFDTMLGEGVVVGMTASMMEGELDYGSGDESIRYETQSTGLHPYIGLRSASGDNQLEVTAGYGLGEVVLDQERYEAETLQSSFHNIGVSGIGRLYSTDQLMSGGTSMVSMEGVSWLARHFMKNEVEFIQGTDTHASYVRLIMEGSHVQTLADRSSVNPKASVGLRADRRGTRSFLGMELGSGLSFKTPVGLSIEGSTTMLMEEGSQVRELGVKGSIDYDNGSDGFGVLLSLDPTWGRTFSNQDNTLWSNSLLSADRYAISNHNGTALKSEIGYGIQIWDNAGILTPFSGMDTSEEKDVFKLGSRLSYGRDVSFALQGNRRIEADQTNAYDVRLNGSYRW